MEEKEYYAVRKGHITTNEVLSFENFKKALMLLYKEMEKGGYFQKYYSKDCPDGDDIGILGDDIKTAVFLRTGISDLWPIYERINYTPK